MKTWKNYIRIGIIQMRDYIPGESLEGVSISQADNPKKGDKIARNSLNPFDLWLVDEKWCKDNYEEMT